VLGLDKLLDEVRSRARPPRRRIEGPLYFAIDHCFAIKGQGTVVTGTVLAGVAKVRPRQTLGVVAWGCQFSRLREAQLSVGLAALAREREWLHSVSSRVSFNPLPQHCTAHCSNVMMIVIARNGSQTI
jgi:hypothetical protein